MLSKSNLGLFIVECLKQKGGKATLVDVSKYIWSNYEEQLRESGDLFYTWQYDYRWQATELRKKGVLKKSGESKYWELV